MLLPPCCVCMVFVLAWCLNGFCCTLHVPGQILPGLGVLDAVSAPGGVELDEPGRGGVSDGRTETAAAQDHQRVLLRVQPGRGAPTAGGEQPQPHREEPEPEHSSRSTGDTQRAGQRQEFMPETGSFIRADMRAAAANRDDLCQTEPDVTSVLRGVKACKYISNENIFK